jgi:outer membrane protein
MSTYILAYGKKHNYDFIFGSSGNGTLMFANETYNISDDIIKYINDKYKGVE